MCTAAADVYCENGSPLSLLLANAIHLRLCDVRDSGMRGPSVDLLIRSNFWATLGILKSRIEVALYSSCDRDGCA